MKKKPSARLQDPHSYYKGAIYIIEGKLHYATRFLTTHTNSLLHKGILLLHKGILYYATGFLTTQNNSLLPNIFVVYYTKKFLYYTTGIPYNTN